MTVTLPLPFRESRSLAPGNPLVGDAAVMLDVVGLDVDDEIQGHWRRRVQHVARHLGWPDPRFVTLAAGVHHTLGFTAPANQLRTAREANEWSLCAAVFTRDPCHWSALREALGSARDCALPALAGGRRAMAVEIDEAAALARLRRLARAEAEELWPA